MKITNYGSYHPDRRNVIALADKIHFFEVIRNEKTHKFKLRTFDLKSRQLQDEAQEIDLTFDRSFHGIKFVMPHSAPYSLKNIHVLLIFYGRASLRSLMDN